MKLIQPTPPPAHAKPERLPPPTTATVTDFVVLPPTPEQVNVYVYEPTELSTPVDADPESAFAPDQLPDAVQLVAFADDHVRVEEPPGPTDIGAAESVTVGAGAGPTTSVTDWRGDVPPGPVHWKVNVVFAVRGLVKPLPDKVPELDQGPPAVQLVAFVEFQVIVGRVLYGVGFGETERVAVGTGGGDTVTVALLVLVPPGPEQERL